MFEKLFKYPRVLTRHREGPGADARELFLTHRYNEGAARNTLTRTASELLLIAKYIDVTTDKPVSTDDLEVAAGRWVRHQQRRRQRDDQRRDSDRSELGDRDCAAAADHEHLDFAARRRSRGLRRPCAAL